MAKFPGFVPAGETANVPVRTGRPVGFVPPGDSRPSAVEFACPYCGKDFSDRKNPAASLPAHERVCSERPKPVDGVVGGTETLAVGPLEDDKEADE